ncbi:excinuclease ABC subunit UvrC [Treponema primitia]|uniref:excinuclease ABC subunit UvrC n=1 Tax=Treponema primitia TaxID=88058 RepID=UPI00397FCF59
MDHERFSENFALLKAFAHDAPQEPGVYIMRDEDSHIIYVGKAKVLRNRLGSYFSGQKDVKTQTLIRHARSIETIIVANEYEALLLENTLIKQHTPKYNINLKDGKTYPVIRITAGPFPRIFKTRHIIEDGSRYFGPFPNVQAVDTLLELIDKLFPLRKCRTLRKRDAPCMYFHIGRCAGPCCGKITEGEYHLHIDRIQKILSAGNSLENTGETDSLIVELTERMHEAASQLLFERAAQIRNAITAIRDLRESPSMVDFDNESRDYIAWAGESILTTWSVFSMRGGKMTGRELYRTRSAAEETESLETFVAAYYTPDRPPPPRIFIGLETETPSPDFPFLKRWFKEQFGYEPELLVPLEKRLQAVLAMARQNALEDLRQRLKERGVGPALDELAQALDLGGRPERIEGFDIAQLDGKHPVASLISFKNGIPDKKNYRYFKLRSVVGVVDDFASMREAVQRRYSRLIREGAELPDLILIDGGIGQVNAAKGVLDELGMHTDIVGLAKRDEELWLPNARNPIRLSKRSEALKILQHVRDETHRFATTLNQKLRSKDLLFPALESVEGIGPKRAAAIMKAYVTLPAIAAASPQDLSDRCNISETAARAVRAAAQLALEDQAAAKTRLTGQGNRARSRFGTPAKTPARGTDRNTGPGEIYPTSEAIAFLAAEAAEEEFGKE